MPKKNPLDGHVFAAWGQVKHAAIDWVASLETKDRATIVGWEKELLDAVNRFSATCDSADAFDAGKGAP